MSHSGAVGAAAALAIVVAVAAAVAVVAAAEVVAVLGLVDVLGLALLAALALPASVEGCSEQAITKQDTRTGKRARIIMYRGTATAVPRYRDEVPPELGRASCADAATTPT